MNSTAKYVRTYELNGQDPISEVSNKHFQGFIADMKQDFDELLEKSKVLGEAKCKNVHEDYRLFKQVVDQMGKKFDAINNKTHGDISRTWKTVYARVICAKRTSLFPEISKRIVEAKASQEKSTIFFKGVGSA